MNSKTILETAKDLLKAAKENPEQFQELEKAKDKPTPAKSRKLDPAIEHSEAWRVYKEKAKSAGKTTEDEDFKSGKLKLGKEELDKTKQDSGINQPASHPKGGRSQMGEQVRSKQTGSAKITSRVNLSNAKDLPKPNLPKAEESMGKAKIDEGKSPEDKASARSIRHDRTSDNEKGPGGGSLRVNRTKWARSNAITMGSPGRVGEKVFGKPHLTQESSTGVHEHSGTMSGKSLPVGGGPNSSSPTSADKTGKSYRVGGGGGPNYTARSRHADVMSAQSKIKPNLPKSEIPMKKDDMPHSPNSPEDKAHDVAEHEHSLNHALKILDTPEKQKAMFDHLKTLHDPSQQRSETNEEAGETPSEERMEHCMDKSEIIKMAKDLIKAAQDPQKFEEMKKAMSAPPPAAPATHPAPKAPKVSAPSAAPKMPKLAPAKVGAPMTKDEIKADMASDWKPKFGKAKC